MARGRKSSLRIVLSSEEQATLERWQRSTTVAAGLVRRGKIIRLLAAGHSHSDVGRSVAVHVVRLACERPDLRGRSLSQWDGTELARQLIAEGVVEGISAATVRRILACHHLKPWRHHLWLSPKHPREAAFYASIAELIDLYTRLLHDDEVVLSVDEKTSLQPRPRLAPMRPAQPGNIPNRDAHEYKRSGALNVFAAFDTRSGIVFGQCYPRKRQQEFIAVLEQLDAELSPISRRFISCAITSAHITAKKSGSG